MRTSVFSTVKVPLLVLPLLVIVVMGALTEPVQSHQEDKDANYHFTKLKEKIDDMKNWIVNTSYSDSSKSHHIQKRAAYERDDLVLDSLVSYCTNFNTDPVISKYMERKAEKQPLSRRAMTGYTRYSSTGKLPSGKWAFDSFPVKVLAQKEDKNIWVVFHVAHSERARVSKLDFFDFQEVVLDFPKSACQKVVSKARFVMPRKNCKRREHFRISFGASRGAINVYINVCRLLGKSKSPIYFKELNVPFFGLETPQSTDKFDQNIFLQNDGRENDNNETTGTTAFTIGLPLSTQHGDKLEIDLTLWDWESKEIIQAKAKVAVRYTSKFEPFSGISTSNSTDDGGQQITFSGFYKDTSDTCSLPSNLKRSYLGEKDQCIPVEINIPAVPGRRSVSGQMTFRERPHDESSADPDIWKSTIEVTVPLVRPQWRQQSLPSDFIYFSPTTRFRCDEHGNKDHRVMGMGENCVVQCQAHGEDISLIYITKRLPPSKAAGRRFTSGSYVLPDMAAAILNVGRVVVGDEGAEDLEGDYECTVVNKRGQTKSQILKLYTSLFTKIESFNLADLEGESVTVNCNVHGDSSVKVSILVGDINAQNKTRLSFDDDDDDDQTSKQNSTTAMTMISESDSYKNLSMTISWSELRHPRKILFCEAEGDRGTDTLDMNLEKYHQNTFGIKPEVNRRDMHVKSLPGNSALATCSATGERPLQVWMMITHYQMPEPRVLLYRNVTAGRGTEKVKMTWTLSRQDDYDIWEDIYISHVICKARNVHGTALTEYRDAFYLNLP